MTIKEIIYEDIKRFMKSRQNTGHLKLILGEIQRLPIKDPSDEETVQVLRKLIKLEEENLNRSGLKTSDYLETIKYYLPKQISNEEISQWIECNIDFSTFKNKYQAMKVILEHFGSSTNGKTVKEILDRLP